MTSPERAQVASTLYPSVSFPKVLARYVILAVSYFIVARLSLILVIQPEGLASVWPASGLALAALLLTERRNWPTTLATIFIANTLANLVGGNPVWISLGFAFANTLEPAAGAWVFERLAGRPVAFQRLRDVLALALVATASNALTALVGAGIVALSFGAGFWDIWSVWWVADGLGILLLTPFIVTWVTQGNYFKTLRWQHVVEGALLTFLLITFAWLIFASPRVDYPILRSYIIFPILVWAGLRFSLRGVSAYLLILTGIVLWGTAKGVGLYSDPSTTPRDHLLAAQSFLSIAGFTTIMVNTILAERKRANQALAESEEHVRSFYQNAPLAYHSLDGDGHLLDVNGLWCSLLGYENNEVTGRWFGDFLPPDQVALFEERFSNFKRRGEARNVEYEMVRKDGAHIIVQIDGKVSYDERGAFQRTHCMLRDITIRKQAETALIQSETRYRQLFDLESDAIFVIDNETGDILEVNPAASALYGYSRDELLSMKNTDVSAEPDQTRAATQGHATAIPIRWHRKKDGGLLPVEIHATRFERDGRPSHLAAIRDISARLQAEEELRHSEERYRRLFENMIEGFAYCRMIFENGQPRDWIYLDVNEPFQALTGLKDVIGKRVTEVIPGIREDDPELFEIYGRVSLTGIPEKFERFVKSLQIWFSVSVYSPQKEYFVAIFDVITSRKLAEDTLRASEEKFSTVFQYAPMLITISSIQDGKYLDVNEAFCKVSGFSRLEAIGKTSVELGWITPADREGLVEILRSQGRVNDLELELHSKDGSLVTCLYNGEIIHVDGEPHLLSIAQNITERKLAEDALRETSDLHEKVFSSTHVQLAYLDSDFNFIRVNQAYAAEDGLEPDYFVGKNQFDLFPDEKTEAIFREVVSKGEGYLATATPFVYIHQPERGISYWDWTLQPVKAPSGEVTGLIISMLNVTERVEAVSGLAESENRFRSIVEHMNDALYIHDFKGDILDVNDNACRMLGYTREELVGTSLARIDSPAASEQTPDHMAYLIANGWLEFDGEHIHKDGRLVPVTVSARVVSAEGDGIVQSIVRDISERKLAEMDRVQRLAELEAINRISTVLRAAPTLDDMLPILLEETLIALDTSAGGLWLADNLNGKMRRGAASGWFTKITEIPVQPGGGVGVTVFASGGAYQSLEFCKDPLVTASVQSQIPPGWGGAWVPIRAASQIVGALVVAVPLPREIQPYEVHFLTTLAEMAGSAIHRATLHDLTERRLHDLQALHEIDRAISSSLDMRVTLQILLEQTVSRLDADAADILLLNPHLNTLEYADEVGFRSRAFEHRRLQLGQGYAGQAALDRRIRTTPDLRVDKDFLSTPLLDNEGFIAYCGVPLVSKGQVKGVLEVYHRRAFVPDAEWLDFLESLARQAAIAIDNTYLFEGLQRSNLELGLAYDATIEGWSRALDLRDHETEDHTERVTGLTVTLARMLGVSDSDLVHVRRGALLHDIGKMGVPDAILNKPGPLNDEEWVTMRKHPLLAFEMLSKITFLRPALEIPYCHHEKWDGTGYPRGMKGEQIPLAARIFAVVDVWDALISVRPYRPAWSHEKARAYIAEQSGAHFDPQVVSTFLNLLDETE